jgi:hypothetical protein
VNRHDRRLARRIAERCFEVPCEVVDFDDGSIELVIGGLSTCGCSRCDMLRAYQALKSDGPPPARATHQFDHSYDEDRYDDHHS